ncbi:hypothetical protein PGB90_002040 [Kerria lacca]
MPNNTEELVINIDKMCQIFEARNEVISIPATTEVKHKTPTIGWQNDLSESITSMIENNCLILGPPLGCLITRLDRRNHEAVARNIMLLASSLAKFYGTKFTDCISLPTVKISIPSFSGYQNQNPSTITRGTVYLEYMHAYYDYSNELN